MKVVQAVGTIGHRLRYKNKLGLLKTEQRQAG